jgi:hypothetical protein
MFVDLLQNTCPMIVVMLDKYVKHVQKYVKGMIWIIVNNIHKYAMNVQKSVEVCRRCGQECKRIVSTI